MKYPTGILKNTATGRFHPISFRLAPFCGGAELPSGDRYKSIGHHTTGFETEAEALAWISENREKTYLLDSRWEWDGSDVPAMVIFLPGDVLVECFA